VHDARQAQRHSRAGISRHANKADSGDLTGVNGQKQMWELRFAAATCQRCAARAALDLESAANFPASTWWPSPNILTCLLAITEC
jgi:hypothetical protein